MDVKCNIEKEVIMFNFEHDGVVHASQIRHIKATEVQSNNTSITDFIKKAVDSLHKMINLYKYDVVVMPEFRNNVNQYMMRYIYRFNQPKLVTIKDIKNYQADEELCASIRNQNILIIDDVTTSGSTLNEILRTLRILNEDNEITIFSLIGRKDLMAESV